MSDATSEQGNRGRPGKQSAAALVRGRSRCWRPEQIGADAVIVMTWWSGWEDSV